MTEMTAEMDQIQVPDGGVASFMMSDEDIASLEREEDQQLAEEVYGGEGISQFTDMAAQMASLGRFGDDVIVHAQTGELVIPKKILDDNPEIKETVFQQLMAQGIEDPEQYVVGSGSASINPETGLAEYFFKGIRRAISKVAKGVKKVASKVVKVAKKVAPIVLPIAMTMLFPALGPIYGAALGSGIGTLVQGGSFKDALKSAAISGLTGAAFQGFTGPGTFSQNVGDALYAPGARFAQVGGQLKSGFSGQGFNFGQKFAGAPSGLSPSGEAPADYRGADYKGAPDSAFNQVNNPGLSPEQIQARDLSIANSNNNMSGYNSSGAPANSMAGQANMQNAGTPQNAANTVKFTPRGGPINSANAGNNLAGAGNSGQNSFMDTVKDSYTKANDFLTIGEAPKSVSQILLESNPPINPANATLEQLNMATNIAKNQAGTGIVSSVIRNSPKIGLGYAVAKKSGVFDTPEPSPEEDSPLGVKQGPTGYERFMANQDDFMVNTATVDPIYTAPVTPYGSYYDFYNPLPTSLASSRPTEGSPFYRPPVYAEKGGEIFPRRTGGIMPDEGIPGKDSVRAMLMPGEFVMTTDAVKGMGDGNLRRGIQSMYGVMANLERKGRMA